jgi:uncharacterized protein (DUF1501 family)
MKTRRQFLHTSLTGVAATWSLPAFLDQTLLRMNAAAADLSTQAATGRDHPILVVLQMGGGNDSLNMVVPHSNDDYYKARPNLAIKAAEAHKLNDSLALHPAMTDLRGLYDEGSLALVNGVGYPNPNRSHFRSMEIWHTASDSEKNEAYGWVGRYFDNACQGCDASVGVNIGSQTPRAFLASKQQLGISFANPNQLRTLGEDSGTPRMRAGGGENAEDSGPAGGSIGEILGNPAMAGGNPVDFLERTALDTQISSNQILEITRRTQPESSYPNGALANDLKLVAQLIAGGLPSRVYYVNQGGYDTHSNQAQAHQRLLGNFSSALAAFCRDLRKRGLLDRVMVMSFSEFGRRVQENASAGTDHGMAGSMFLAGGAVKAGIYGQYPSLDPKDLDKGDVKHRVDFRSVYATVLENWLRTPSQPILGRAFEKLDVC